MTLDWRDATKQDRPALQAFTCTTPPPTTPGQRRAGPHPKPWEHDVQRAIRNLPTPLRGDNHALLGWTDTGRIGAISVWTRIHNRPLHKIQLVAIARQFRGTPSDQTNPGAIADELLDTTLAHLSQTASGHAVFGLVDHRNRPSLRLLRNHGFEHNPDIPIDDPDLQAWSARIP